MPDACDNGTILVQTTVGEEAGLTVPPVPVIDLSSTYAILTTVPPPLIPRAQPLRRHFDLSADAGGKRGPFAFITWLCPALLVGGLAFILTGGRRGVNLATVYRRGGATRHSP